MASGESLLVESSGHEPGLTRRKARVVRRWISLIALAVGIFALITIEELPIGVLSVMAPDLGVSEGIAGLTVTIPGVLAGVVAVADRKSGVQGESGDRRASGRE